MQIIPLGKRVTISLPKPEETTKSGIHLTAPASKRMSEGVVENVGKGVKSVKKGDKVLFSPFHYDDVEEGLIVIDEEDIWAIVS